MTEEQQRWYEKQKEAEEKFGSLIDKLDKNTSRTIPVLEENYRGNYDALYVRTYSLYDEETLKHKYLGLGRYKYKEHYFLVYRKGDLVESARRGFEDWSDGDKGRKEIYMWEYDPESTEGKLLDELISIYNKHARRMWDKWYYIALDHGAYDYYNWCTWRHPQYYEEVKPAPHYKYGWYMDLTNTDGWENMLKEYITRDEEYWKRVNDEQVKKKWGWLYLPQDGTYNDTEPLSDILVGGWILGSFLFIIIGYFLSYNLVNYIWVTLVVMVLYFMAVNGNNKDYVKKE